MPVPTLSRGSPPEGSLTWADQGAVSIPAGNAIHEWVHDGRHLLGYPCH